MVMSSPLAGQVMTTFLAPASMCFWASSPVLKMPVDSTTTSTPRSPQGRLDGSRSESTLNAWPSATMPSSVASTDENARPWTESYFSRCAIVGMSPKSLTATTSRSGSFAIARNTSRPMRPNPLMPTFVAMRISFRQDTHSPSKRHRDHTTSALLRRAFGPLSREKADERRAPAPQRGRVGARHGASASAPATLRDAAAWNASASTQTELRGSAA